MTRLLGWVSWIIVRRNGREPLIPELFFLRIGKVGCGRQSPTCAGRDFSGLAQVTYPGVRHTSGSKFTLPGAEAKKRFSVVGLCERWWYGGRGESPVTPVKMVGV